MLHEVYDFSIFPASLKFLWRFYYCREHNCSLGQSTTCAE